MSPQASRQEPVYMQIAAFHRDKIASGELQPGERIPSITDLAREWKVSTSTAAKAIGRLQVEGVIYTSPQGSFVADKDVIDRTPGERFHGSGPATDAINGERIEVTETGTVTAPNYVAELLGIPIGTLVVRREEITHRHGRPSGLSVDWTPAFNRDVVAELTQPAPVPGGTAQAIERHTGQLMRHGDDHIRARACDAREADALHVATGSPVLAGAHLWATADGTVALYGEWVLPPDKVIHYAYEMRTDQQDTEG